MYVKYNIESKSLDRKIRKFQSKHSVIKIVTINNWMHPCNLPYAPSVIIGDQNLYVNIHFI
jgi:hypothetical protein